jgi:hypothetical protein
VGGGEYGFTHGWSSGGWMPKQVAEKSAQGRRIRGVAVHCFESLYGPTELLLEGRHGRSLRLAFPEMVQDSTLGWTQNRFVWTFGSYGSPLLAMG